jgi:hypothetical protein
LTSEIAQFMTQDPIFERHRHSHLRDGHASEAAAWLRQALTIYQRIAAPAARRVQETLIQASQGNLAPER